MQNMTPQQMRAMIMQQQQQPTALMPTASNSAIIAKLLANGGAATPTDPLGRGMSNAADSLSAAFSARQAKIDAEKAEDERLEKMIAAMKVKVQ